jgi:hypothetical protein
MCDHFSFNMKWSPVWRFTYLKINKISFYLIHNLHSFKELYEYLNGLVSPSLCIDFVSSFHFWRHRYSNPKTLWFSILKVIIEAFTLLRIIFVCSDLCHTLYWIITLFLELGDLLNYFGDTGIRIHSSVLEAISAVFIFLQIRMVEGFFKVTH